MKRNITKLLFKTIHSESFVNLIKVFAYFFRLATAYIAHLADMLSGTSTGENFCADLRALKSRERRKVVDVGDSGENESNKKVS